MMYERKQQIYLKARELLTTDFVIIDTETTGLDSKAEIVEIAAIDQTGNVLLNTLVMPSDGIVPREAVAIHGISYRKLLEAGAKPIGLDQELHDKITDCIAGKHVVIYNADFDLRILWQSFKRNNSYLRACHKNTCIMQMYAIYYGDWSSWHSSYRWQKLDDACRQLGISTKNLGKAHSALGDCFRTLEVLKAMARGK